jgi:hypothetical protein
MKGEHGGDLAIELTEDTDKTRSKIMCLQLAENDIVKYKELYYNTPVYEVYEIMTLINAINYRDPEER